MTSSERFLQIRNSDFMIVDPILQKRKLGLKERHTTNVWQSQTWNPGLLTLSSLVFRPHHTVQLRSLSKQGPNQTPSLCRNFWLLFLTYMGSNTTSLPSKPFPLFLFSFFFFLSLSNCTPPSTNLFGQSYIPLGPERPTSILWLDLKWLPTPTHSVHSSHFSKHNSGPTSSQTRRGDLIQATLVPLSAPFASCPTNMALMCPCIFTPQLQVHELLGPHLWYLLPAFSFHRAWLRVSGSMHVC